MGGHRDIPAPRSKLVVLLAWALTMSDALVPAYAVGGLGELRVAGGMERRKERLHATGAAR
jgi:hypothetical protein